MWTGNWLLSQWFFHSKAQLNFQIGQATDVSKTQHRLVFKSNFLTRTSDCSYVFKVTGDTCPSHVFAPWPQQLASCFCAKAIWWHAELSFLKWLEKDIRNNKNVSLVVSSDRRWIVSWQATDCLMTGDGLSHDRQRIVSWQAPDCLMTGDGLSHDMRHAFSATNK